MQDVPIAASIRPARPADALEIARLVNAAYQVEAFFVDGERTSASDVLSKMNDGTFLVIDAPEGLVGAVFVDGFHLAATAGVATIGMLSVAPNVARLGLGRRLLAVAEALASALGSHAARLYVVNVRTELIRWYRSLGYVEIGDAPYVHRPTKQPVHFVVLAKPLSKGGTERKGVRLGAPLQE